MTITSTTAVSALFEPMALGAIEVSNRVIMAPLTRLRADGEGIPGDLIVEHYRQRASFGMLITEGTYPSMESQAYVGQPGIATDEQAAGWKRVAAAVHAGGGRIVMQLMHGGRTSHPEVNGGRRVLGPSAIAINGQTHTEKGKQDFPVPHEMTVADIQAAIQDHVEAAQRAIDAGMDGVEIHAANGYLIQQFLAPGSNKRTDDYGGSPEKRSRFAIEVITAVAGAVGAERVGVRISPEHQQQDCFEHDREDVRATYDTLLEAIRILDLAYLSVLHHEPAGDLVQGIAETFEGKLLINNGFSSITELADANAMIKVPFADGVLIGRAAIANPDLVERWKGGHELNEPRPEFFYHSTGEGYTDYPFLGQER